MNEEILIDFVLTNNLTDEEIGGKIPFPSYTLKQLMAQTPSEIDGAPVIVNTFDEAFARYDLNRRPNILCVTTLTPGVPRAKELADLAKGITSHDGRPIITVVGGIHATCLPEEMLGHFDIVVRGETNAAFQEFVFKQALNYCSPRDKQVFRLKEVPQTLDHPLIKWNKSDLDNCYACPLQGSGGCAGGCPFCSVTAVHGAKPRYVSDQRFNQAIDEIPQRLPIALFDDNVLQSSALPCIDRLVSRAAALRDRKRRWAAEVTMKTLSLAQKKMREERNFDLIGYLASCGLVGLYFGIESVDENVDLKKKISNAEAANLIHYCRSCGISVLGAFVLGISPNETPDYAKKVLEFAIEKANLDMIQVSINTPLPGSANFIEAVRNNRIIDADWRNYDGAHCVFRHETMSKEELEEAHYQVLKNFYSTTSIGKREIWGTECFASKAWKSHLWTVIPNIALALSCRKWPARRARESWRVPIREFEPEVIKAVEKALIENPERPYLFKHDRTDDGISIHY